MKQVETKINHYWQIISHVQSLIALSDNKVNILIALTGGMSAFFLNELQKIPSHLFYLKYVYILSFIVSIISCLASLFPRGLKGISLAKWTDAIDKDNLEAYSGFLLSSVNILNNILALKTKSYKFALSLSIIQVLIIAIVISTR